MDIIDPIRLYDIIKGTLTASNAKQVIDELNEDINKDTLNNFFRIVGKASPSKGFHVTNLDKQDIQLLSRMCDEAELKYSYNIVLGEFTI